MKIYNEKGICTGERNYFNSNGEEITKEEFEEWEENEVYHCPLCGLIHPAYVKCYE